jgi:hypothetical protein
VQRRQIMFRRRSFALIMRGAEEIAEAVGVAVVAAEQRL